MKKSEKIQEIKLLLEKISKKFPPQKGEDGDSIPRVIKVENKHLKKGRNLIAIDSPISKFKDEYEYHYIHFPIKNLTHYLCCSSIKMDGNTTKELSLFISLLKSLNKGTEIKEHKTFFGEGKSPFYEVTSRIEASIDFWEMVKAFDFLNNYYKDKCDGSSILPIKYESTQHSMGSDFCHLAIHKKVNLLDLKSLINILCVDCHVASQSMDYICFDGQRDRDSQQPSTDRINKWKKIVDSTK